LKKKVKIIEATISKRPPSFCHFQAMIVKANKIKLGIKCITKAMIFSKSEKSFEKASSANMLMKTIYIIAATLGSQYLNEVALVILNPPFKLIVEERFRC